MRMISDEEVDKLAESMALGLDEYKMAYFSQDFIGSLPEAQRKTAQALLQPFQNRLKGKTTMSESLKSWKI